MAHELSDGDVYLDHRPRHRAWLELVDPPLGSLLRIPPGGGPAIELAAGELILPAGVASLVRERSM